MLAFYTLLVLVLLRLVFIGLLVWWLVSVGPSCPACGGGETIRVRSRGPLGWLGAWVERRFCLQCGWGGLTRRLRRVARPQPGSVSAR